MRAIILSPMLDLLSACRAMHHSILELLDPQEPLCIKIFLESFDAEIFFRSSSGLVRAYFRSRDQDLELCGQGIAHKFVHKFCALGLDQFYMGGMSFDNRGPQAHEWKGFEQQFFFLPLLQVTKRQQQIVLMLNYHPHDHRPFCAWRDHALSLLQAVSQQEGVDSQCFDFVKKVEEPAYDYYAKIIDEAKAIFASRPECRKVVLGRRNTHIFSHALDPVVLFFALASKSKGFSFLLDVGFGSVFFGVSPELLYRRLGRNFETESLAGTRPRSRDENEDTRLQQDLFNSYKDQFEHALVSEHIEARLKEFGATDLFTSRLEIMSLPFVQHLVKRYHGHINSQLSDEEIINALHPTPAVCGLERQWALNFIREHEGFDRGFYAGPIGYIGQDQAELAVAIRSALYYQQQLYVYAACGIVAQSEVTQEWDELTNKQKNIVSLLSFKENMQIDELEKNR